MQFADTVRSQITAKGWSIKRFADEISRTPEHARKISAGRAFPSDDLAERIADKLDIDNAELQKQLAADRWEKKYKKKPPQSERPDLGPLESIWEELSTDQREYMLCVANCLIMKKRRRARAQ
jgi:ribosome-binding protein aMBF1 (putative translation factor)